MELDDIGEMIGQRIRQMSMGIHRLDLDQMLDLDMMNIGPERRSGQDKSEQNEKFLKNIIFYKNFWIFF